MLCYYVQVITFLFFADHHRVSTSAGQEIHEKIDHVRFTSVSTLR